MKNIFTFIFCFLFAFHVSSQNTWSWAKRSGGTENDGGISSTTDGSGNTIVAGYFASGTISFGSITLTNSNATTNDIFVVKYDASGNVVWASSVGIIGNEYVTAITTDLSGNVYVTGYNTNGSTSTKDVYLTKFNSSGSFQWTKSAVGSADEETSGIATDASGNIYIAGNFESPSLSFSTISLTNSGVADMFLTKYDSNGNVLWVKSATGNHAELARAVSVDASGSIYVAGYFYSPYVVFEQDTVMNTSVNYPSAFDPDGIDMFVLKYNSTGNIIWVKSYGGAEHEQAMSVSLSGNSIYVGGNFSSSVVAVGSVSLTNNSISGLSDCFVMKMDMNGNVAWCRSIGASNHDYFQSIKADGAGNVFMTGQFSAVSLNTSTGILTNAGNADSFIIKYDGNGNELFVMNIGGAIHENARSLGTDAAGNLYVAGFTNSPSLTFGANSLSAAGGFDMFVAKMSSTPSGISSFAKEPEEGKIKPNPTTGYFSVDVSEFEGRIITISVFNVTGKKVLEKTVPYSETDYFIDLSSEGEGVYFVKLNSGGVVKTTKIVVKR